MDRTTVPSNERFVLRTTETSFTSKGAFVLVVKQIGRVKVTTRGGFENSVPLLEEVPVPDMDELDRTIRDSTAQISKLRNMDSDSVYRCWANQGKDCPQLNEADVD